MRGSGFLILLLFCCLYSSAQEIRVKAGFHQDSLSIGEPVEFWMTALYPADVNLTLPDTNYNFSPFEFISKSYDPTVSRGSLLFDSVTYTLQSFEIDTVQYLQSVAKIWKEDGFTKIEPPIDSIIFRDLVENVSDTVALHTNLQLAKVKKTFNYPLFSIIGVGFFIIALVVFLIFGKKVRRAWRIRRLRKAYTEFSIKITDCIKIIRKEPTPQNAEFAVAIWKKYLEKLEKKPYSKYTSKEILSFPNNRELNDALNAIDCTVYGEQVQKELYKSYQEIEDFTQHRYNMALDSIKNGN